MDIMTDREIIDQILEELGFILINYTDGLRSYEQYKYNFYDFDDSHITIEIFYKNNAIIDIKQRVSYYGNFEAVDKIIANLFNNIPPLTYIKNKLNNIKISESRNKFIEDILES